MGNNRKIHMRWKFPFFGKRKGSGNKQTLGTKHHTDAQIQEERPFKMSLGTSAFICQRAAQGGQIPSDFCKSASSTIYRGF